MTERSIQEEVDRNYESFRKILPKIINQHRGKYALMRDGDIVTYFSTPDDARAAGEKLYSDSRFSIQQVTDVSINLVISAMPSLSFRYNPSVGPLIQVAICR